MRMSPGDFVRALIDAIGIKSVRNPNPNPNPNLNPNPSPGPSPNPTPNLPLVRVDRAVEPLELHVVLLEQLAEEVERLREVGHEDPSVRRGLLHLEQRSGKSS